MHYHPMRIGLLPLRGIYRENKVNFYRDDDFKKISNHINRFENVKTCVISKRVSVSQARVFLAEYCTISASG